MHLSQLHHLLPEQNVSRIRPHFSSLMKPTCKTHQMGTHRNPIPVSIQARLTKFYVTKLPDRCSGSDLAGTIREYGNIYDIYIARKRDKGGSRFGFVSLLDVKDRGDMERKLSNIRMGEHRLKFNVARFILEEGEINTRRDPSRERVEKQEVGRDNKRAMEDSSRSNMSYKEVVAGVRTVEIAEDGLAFEEWFGRAIIVQMTTFEALRSIKDILKEMGLSEGVVRYLGGMSVMISFKNKEHTVMARDEILGRKEQFASVDIWEGQSLTYQRIAWLRIYGVPIHLLTNKVLNDVGSIFGTIVKPAEPTWDDVDVSFYYVGVLVEDGMQVQDAVYLRWRGKRIKVWVTEAPGVWLPEFVSDNRVEEGRYGKTEELAKTKKSDKVGSVDGGPAAAYVQSEDRQSKEVNSVMDEGEIQTEYVQKSPEPETKNETTIATQMPDGQVGGKQSQSSTHGENNIKCGERNSKLHEHIFFEREFLF